MPTIVGVRLRFSKTLWFDPAGANPDEGDLVIVETERGLELGTVVRCAHDVVAESIPSSLKPVVRVANEDDYELAGQLQAKEREALPYFRELVEHYRLDMKPVAVEYVFDGDKIIFYFSADERVDFRELVKDLAAHFHTRIDMRQIGVRDEARAVGGVGHCGQILCCVRFGGDFQPVSIRMAKEQDLPLNPLKISGLCGRLMCCLRYEFDAYKDFKGRAPKRGAIIETAVGLAKVTEMNTPREMITMRFEDGERVTVPLAGMTCGKGAGCPCSVDREVLAEAGNAAAIALMPVEDDGLEPLRAEKPMRAEKPPQRRERSEKKEKGAGESAPKKREPSVSSEPAAERTGTPRRRRRRGGSGAGSGATEPVAQGTAAPKPPSEQPKPPQGEAGDAAQPSTGRKRRRRRRSGGGGGGSTTPQE